MFEHQSIVPEIVTKEKRALVGEAPSRAPDAQGYAGPRHNGPKYDAKQRRLMQIALAMLLVALGLVLYRNRDFWFPDTQEADTDQPAETSPAAAAPVQTLPVTGKSAAPTLQSKHHIVTNTKPQPKESNPAAPAAPAAATMTRTVLPPLEVEVVAGDSHSTVRPGNNAVHVELQPGVPPLVASDAGISRESTAASLTSNAAERVQMSADTSEVVTHPVKPGYPLLARQMKVQGSVILRALISKDGAIQDLHVLSGPAILASAAQDAVRQWRFKPHYLGTEAVETQARITVNFTISTN
jgi:protein TonB